MNCKSRISQYLQAGGLFNAELMEHKKVSELLQDCSAEITELERRLEVAVEALEKIGEQSMSMHIALPAMNIEMKKIAQEALASIGADRDKA